MADADTLTSALCGDIAELDRLLTKVRTEHAERKFKVIGLRAAVAKQLRFEDQQNRLMRWLIDNEPTASLDIEGNLDVVGVIIAILERQRQQHSDLQGALDIIRHQQEMEAQNRQQRGGFGGTMTDGSAERIADCRQQWQQLPTENSKTGLLNDVSIGAKYLLSLWKNGHILWYKGVSAA